MSRRRRLAFALAALIAGTPCWVPLARATEDDLPVGGGASARPVDGFRPPSARRDADDHLAGRRARGDPVGDASSTLKTNWTLTDVPSGGSLSSVTRSGAIVTLTLTQGAGAADTSVGLFKIALAAAATGVRDAAGNQASFAAQAPADLASRCSSV